MKFIVIKMSSYSQENGYQEWFEFQPQYNNDMIYVNMENINEQNRRNERTH